MSVKEKKLNYIEGVTSSEFCHDWPFDPFLFLMLDENNNVKKTNDYSMYEKSRLDLKTVVDAESNTRVSTILLPCPYPNIITNEEYYFETMIFSDKPELNIGYQRRSKTYQEALAMHREGIILFTPFKVNTDKLNELLEQGTNK